ncbi:MAG TPA: hypothetical protein PLH00_04105 [Bacteroidaceae bacterium]|nr:hypothetical protein [Bacteroidaceae bacterium]
MTGFDIAQFDYFCERCSYLLLTIDNALPLKALNDPPSTFLAREPPQHLVLSSDSRM